MPILVKCPNGCRLRVPTKRAGQVVRCPKCKALIKIDPISKATTTETTVSNTETEEIETEPVSIVQPEAPHSEAPFTESQPIAVGPSDSEDLPIISIASSKSEPIERLDDLNLDAVNEAPDNSEYALRKRAFRSRDDRVLLAKIFAALLCLVAAINLVPAIYGWVRWAQFGEPLILSRWMYLQIFVAALHVIYAVFLVQIPDWSALRTVAVAMLVFAFIFGTISTGLLIGKGHGAIAGFLELPYALTTRASIWCVAMLCLSTLISFLSGREAENWRRTEQLLNEILAAKSRTGVSS